MAFSFTIDNTTTKGSKRCMTGTYTSNGGSTGGTITTGMLQVEGVLLTPTGAAVAANAPVINGTYPINGGSVVIVTDANQTGYWEAQGL